MYCLTVKLESALSPEQHVCCRYECFQEKFDSVNKKKHKTNKKRKNGCQNSNEMQPEFLKTLHFDFRYKWTMPLHRIYMLYGIPPSHMASFGK